MERKGWRKIFYSAAAIAALPASGPLLPVEMAMWLSGELLLYLEVVSGVWLTSRVAGWKSLPAWLKGKAAQVRRYIEIDWPRSHPSLATWVQWTFASI